jgi:hypothetical protein
MLTVKSKIRHNLPDVHDHTQHGDDKACLCLRRLYSGLPRQRREGRVLAVLQAFIEDSGRGQEDKPVFVLAGYVARVQAWEAFADEWQKALDKYPKVEYLKGKEAIGLFGQFKGWTEEARDRRVLQLVAIANKYAKFAVTLAVHKPEFDRILKQNSGVLKKLYVPAVATITLGVLASVFKQPTFEKLEFIYDEGMLHGKVFEDAYQAMMMELPIEVTRCIGRKSRMEDDKEFLPLQAADLLAWHFRNDLVHKWDNHLYESPIWAALKNVRHMDLSMTTGFMTEQRRRLELLLSGKLRQESRRKH